MDPLSLAFRLLKGVAGWPWVVAILGFARPAAAAPAGSDRDFGVRRHPVTRFLLGLKPQPSGMV